MLRVELIQNLRANKPALLDWDRLRVRVLKDPGKPLTRVSKLGVIHGGLEKESAIYRISDGTSSFIVKQYFDTAILRRERANMSFVNMVDLIAPEILYSDDETNTILMEDLGDMSLAYLWKNGLMKEYEEWVYRSMRILAQVQSYYSAHRARLEALYEGMVPCRNETPPLPDGLSSTIDEILRISRGTELEKKHRESLQEVEIDLKAKMEDFIREYKDFVMDIIPLHVIEKDGRIRLLDFTAPPIGSVLFQFNATWHLQSRREIILYYLRERDGLNLPHIDHEEFLWLADGLQLLECIEWIRIYCGEIIQGRHFLTDLEGRKLSDYERSEGGNLQALYRALAPHKDFCTVIDILDEYFRAPLIKSRENAPDC